MLHITHEAQLMKTKQSIVLAVIMVFALIFSTPQFASAAQTTKNLTRFRKGSIIQITHTKAQRQM